jgi:hypothetical protein
MIFRMLVAGCIIFSSFHSLCAQSHSAESLRFDLTKIAFMINGQPVCEDKGRLQDFPSKEMDRIIAAGKSVIPALIAMITDERNATTSTEPVICYWYGMAVGDLAFCTLMDLFTDSTGGKTTMPGANWNDIIGPDDGKRPVSDQFNIYVKRHGRKVLQAKWQRLWNKYETQMYWDSKERCFKLNPGK